MDLRTRLNLIWLAADDPTGGRAEVIEALKAGLTKAFTFNTTPQCMHWPR